MPLMPVWDTDFSPDSWLNGCAACKKNGLAGKLNRFLCAGTGLEFKDRDNQSATSFGQRP